ncbi:hypothetical protein ACIBKZ_01805 [Streptomyces sp. NPDC050421]|uniref:hypothetical protein n=1 Tax=unclassified Streptomyces TaxID=2593676 RepID=UPI0037AEC2CB
MTAVPAHPTPRWHAVPGGLRDGDRYEKRLAPRPFIHVPTITLDAERAPFTPPPGDGSSYIDRFTGPYDHRLLRGIGHNQPPETPTAFAQAVVDTDSF